MSTGQRKGKYTKEEDDYIIANYEHTPKRIIGEKLGRDPKSIQKRARVLGVKKEPVRVWTKEEDDYILKAHNNGDTLTKTAQSLKRNINETQNRAHKLGIKSWQHIKEGKRTKEGYDVIAYRHNKPTIMKHRRVVENILGRELRSDEIVHHIDADVNNNEPINLFLCNSREHALCHWSLRKCLRAGENAKELIKSGEIVFNKQLGKYERLK